MNVQRWFFVNVVFFLSSLDLPFCVPLVVHVAATLSPIAGESHSSNPQRFYTCVSPESQIPLRFYLRREKKHQKSRILRRLTRRTAQPSLSADNILSSSSVKWTLSWICMTTRISISVNHRDNLDKRHKATQKKGPIACMGKRKKLLAFVLPLYRSTLAAMNLRWVWRSLRW